MIAMADPSPIRKRPGPAVPADLDDRIVAAASALGGSGCWTCRAIAGRVGVSPMTVTRRIAAMQAAGIWPYSPAVRPGRGVRWPPLSAEQAARVAALCDEFRCYAAALARRHRDLGDEIESAVMFALVKAAIRWRPDEHGDGSGDDDDQAAFARYASSCVKYAVPLALRDARPLGYRAAGRAADGPCVESLDVGRGIEVTTNRRVADPGHDHDRNRTMPPSIYDAIDRCFVIRLNMPDGPRYVPGAAMVGFDPPVANPITARKFSMRADCEDYLDTLRPGLAVLCVKATVEEFGPVVATAPADDGSVTVIKGSPPGRSLPTSLPTYGPVQDVPSFDVVAMRRFDDPDANNHPPPTS